MTGQKEWMKPWSSCDLIDPYFSVLVLAIYVIWNQSSLAGQTVPFVMIADASGCSTNKHTQFSSTEKWSVVEALILLEPKGTA